MSSSKPAPALQIVPRDSTPAPSLNANVVRFPTRNPFPAAPAAAETVRLTLRREVTTLEIERRIER